MASRLASVARSTLRLSSSASRNAFRSTAGRRAMSSSAPAPKSDTPWIIGSLVVFGPAFAYLLSPSAPHRGKEHDSHGHGHKEHHAPAKVELTDDEGTKEDVTQSVAAAEHEDVPKAEPDNAAAPEPAKVEMTDEEGTKADVTRSVAAAETEDAPKAEPSADKVEAPKPEKKVGASDVAGEVKPSQ